MPIGVRSQHSLMSISYSPNSVPILAYSCRRRATLRLNHRSIANGTLWQYPKDILGSLHVYLDLLGYP